MRLLTLLVLAGCGGTVLSDGGVDAGGDAGSTQRRFVCGGYVYCNAADGGSEPLRFDVPICSTNALTAHDEALDGGRLPACAYCSFPPCGASFGCTTDGGGC